MAETKKEGAVFEVITEDKIDESLKGLKKDFEKIEYLKRLFKEDKYKGLRKHIVETLFPLLVKDGSEVVVNKLVYDSFSEGLEPIYFWILDFMRDSAPGGLGLDVKKGSEEYEASASSGYFGEIGARNTQMQQKAAEYLGAINQVVKSMVNLLYDLREFEMRMKDYDKANDKDPAIKEAGEQVLKTIWMDQVDMKKGRGSINGLAQDLRFITLRDAFFVVRSAADVDKKELDLNDRVKRILKTKLEEFNSWRIESEREIRKRYNVEKAYLRSQLGSLRLYASWVTPYLKAAQKLKMKEFKSPDVIDTFSNMQTEIQLYGFKEIKPGDVHDSFKKIKLLKKYYSVISVDLKFRTVPQALQGQGGRHYVHGGRVDVVFKGYVMDDTEVTVIKEKEFYEDIDLIEKWVGVGLQDLQNEVEDYFNPKEQLPKVEKKKQSLENPFKGTTTGFKEMFLPILGVGKLFKSGSEKQGVFVLSKIKDAAKGKTEELNFKIYNTYKKVHGMINWS